MTKVIFFYFGFVVEKKGKASLCHFPSMPHQLIKACVKDSKSLEKKGINMQLSHAIVVDVVCPMKGEDG